MTYQPPVSQPSFLARSILALGCDHGSPRFGGGGPGPKRGDAVAGERGRTLLRRLPRRRVLDHHFQPRRALPPRFSPTSGRLSHKLGDEPTLAIVRGSV